MSSYEDLELQWRDLVENFEQRELGLDSVYLPNIKPSGPVDYILIGQEPSRDWSGATESGHHSGCKRWVTADSDDARANRLISDCGLRNFVWSPTDFGVHWAVRDSLIARGKLVHSTDIGKGSARVEDASKLQKCRWPRWLPSLKAEIKLVGPRARLVAMGCGVGAFLERELDRPVDTVLHYSSQNSGPLSKLADEFEFAREDKSRLHREIYQVAKGMVESLGYCSVLRDRILRRIGADSGRKTHHLRVAFVYSKLLKLIDQKSPRRVCKL